MLTGRNAETPYSGATKALASRAHHHEIGWTVQRDRWGRGYATEGARAVLDWTWGVDDVPRIISITDLDNRRSQRVMEKLGLTRRGTTHWHEHDVVWYSVDRPAQR